MSSVRRARTLSLTQGSLLKNMFMFSLPLMLSNVLQVLFNMSDVAVVGRFGTPDALGAVGSTTTYVALFTGLLIGLGTGINSIVAQRIGAGDDDGVSRASHTAFLVSIAFGIVVSVAAIALARPVLTAMGTKSEFMDGALLYVYIYFSGSVATSVYNCGNGVFSADRRYEKAAHFPRCGGRYQRCFKPVFRHRMQNVCRGRGYGFVGFAMVVGGTDSHCAIQVGQILQAQARLF